MTNMTGRTQYRRTWWTGRLVLQVEILVVHTNAPDIGTFSELEWRDAKVEDLALLGPTHQMIKEAA